MAKYRVQLIRGDWFNITVEAESEDDALDQAFNEAPNLCTHCTGWGLNSNGGVDADEWSMPEDYFGDFSEGRYGKTVELVEG
jgi:hypothetical protein